MSKTKLQKMSQLIILFAPSDKVINHLIKKYHVIIMMKIVILGMDHLLLILIFL